ncbi:hypothetical protein [Pontibacter pamirensis]|uniref:hypothetical protein n=1 Tax=Pontibacter pamirensis TaxID=2562824 RepID=UPI001389C319|nr:hypothetical protein [Pontibacter pamirensis]
MYYGYHISSTSSPTSRGFGSNNRDIEGEFVITGYDAKYKVVSGYFEVKTDDIDDLTTYYANPADAPRVDVSITGEFKNVKLKEV